MSATESHKGNIPSGVVREELEKLLREDESRLGDVYRLRKEGKSPQEISEELNVKTYGFVYKKEKAVRAILEGDIPVAPTTAEEIARKFRSMLRRNDISDEARETLKETLKELEASARNPLARQEESKRVEEKSQDLESRLMSGKRAGIYVYSFATYIQHPKDEEYNRVCYKIGQSQDIRGRVDNQTKTAMPEKPIILRVYELNENQSDTRASLRKTERNFHDWLNTACHSWDEGGREWFLTTLEFLDKVASSLDLKIYENDAMDSSE